MNFISKVIERVVAAQFQEHTMAQNLENTFQSAYRDNHSTETALLNLASGKISTTALGKRFGVL